MQVVDGSRGQRDRRVKTVSWVSGLTMMRKSGGEDGHVHCWHVKLERLLILPSGHIK